MAVVEEEEVFEAEEELVAATGHAGRGRGGGGGGGRARWRRRVGEEEAALDLVGEEEAAVASVLTQPVGLIVPRPARHRPFS